MSKFIADGVLKCNFVSTLASTTAPSAAEINAGTDLTPFLRSLTTPFDGSTVDAGTADSAFNSTVPGTYGGQPLTATMTRDNVYANDDAWTALPRLTAGYFVIAPRGTAGATFAASDRVEVWQVEVISRNPTPYGRNELVTFELMCSVNSEPNIDVTCAA